MIKAPVSDSGQPLGKCGAAAPSADEPNSLLAGRIPSDERDSLRAEPQCHYFFTFPEFESTVRTVNQFFQSLG